MPIKLSLFKFVLSVLYTVVAQLLANSVPMQGTPRKARFPESMWLLNNQRVVIFYPPIRSSAEMILAKKPDACTRFVNAPA